MHFQLDDASEFFSYVTSASAWSYLWLLPIAVVFVVVFRRETPVVYARSDCYPNSYILPYLTTLREYVPTPWLCSRHLETIVPLLLHVPPLDFVRITEETIEVKALQSFLDSGQITLQWTTEPLLASVSPELCPVVVLCPGLTGGLRTAYMTRIVKAIVNEGWQAAVFNPRGSGPSKLRTPQAYSAGFTDDLRQVIRVLKRRNPKRPLFAVGYSLGSNYLCKYVGEESDQCPLSGAVCVSALTDLSACARHYERSYIGRLYNALLTKSLISNVLKRALALFEPNASGQTLPKPPQREMYDRRVISHATRRQTKVRLCAMDSGYLSEDVSMESSGSSDSSDQKEDSDSFAGDSLLKSSPAFRCLKPAAPSIVEVAGGAQSAAALFDVHQLEDCGSGAVADDEVSTAAPKTRYKLRKCILNATKKRSIGRSKKRRVATKKKKPMTAMKAAALYRESSRSAMFSSSVLRGQQSESESEAAAIGGVQSSAWHPYKAQRSRTLRDFDHYLTSASFGYRCATEYYAKCSALLYLQDICVPTLTVNARNDPIVPHSVIQADSYFANPFLTAVLTRYGAHSMDYLTGWRGKDSWTARLVVDYLRAVLMVETRAKDITRK